MANDFLLVLIFALSCSLLAIKTGSGVRIVSSNFRVRCHRIGIDSSEMGVAEPFVSVKATRKNGEVRENNMLNF